MTSDSTAFNITPREHQLEHIDDIVEWMHHESSYIEGSPMGAGKTYMTSYIANKIGMAMMVICPSNVKMTWEKVIRENGAFIPIINTHGEIIGQSGKERIPSFRYLTRHDTYTYNENGTKVKETRYETTEYFDQLLDQGIFIVFDEVSTLKNEGILISKAVITLVNALVNRATKSRFALISAFLLDSEEQAFNYASLLGFTDRPITDGGLTDVVDVCKYLSRPETDNVMSKNKSVNSMTKTEAYHLVYELMKDIVIPRFRFDVPDVDVDADLAVGFYNMSNIEYERYSLAVHALQQLVKYDPITGDTSSVSLSEMDRIMRDIEYCKLGVIAREVIKVLNTEPTSKIIINIESKGSIAMLSETLFQFGIGHKVIDGSVVDNDRTDIVEQFQEPNLILRVLIASTRTCGTGISFHDLHGGFPRTTFIAARFKLQETAQATKRTVREGTLSKPTVRIVNGKHCTQTESDISVLETRILNALSLKSEVGREFQASGKSKLILPSDFVKLYDTPDPSVALLRYPSLEQDGINLLSIDEITDIKKRGLVYNITASRYTEKR